jgi:hypothetical protein
MTDFGPTYSCTMTGDVDLGLQADAKEASLAPLPVIRVDSLEATETEVKRAGGVITKPTCSSVANGRLSITVRTGCQRNFATITAFGGDLGEARPGAIGARVPRACMSAQSWANSSLGKGAVGGRISGRAAKRGPDLCLPASEQKFDDGIDSHDQMNAGRAVRSVASIHGHVALTHTAASMRGAQSWSCLMLGTLL